MGVAIYRSDNRLIKKKITLLSLKTNNYLTMIEGFLDLSYFFLLVHKLFDQLLLLITFTVSTQ
jgi:hypothetical protein